MRPTLWVNRNFVQCTIISGYAEPVAEKFDVGQWVELARAQCRAESNRRGGICRLQCVNSSLRISGQPKNCIDDDVGRTLDKLPDDIEVDPELRTKQRQNK
jgi:hypothetical protein